MSPGTLRENLLRWLWWFAFALLSISAFLYAWRPASAWGPHNVNGPLALLAWTAACRALAARWPRVAAVTYLVGFYPLAAWAASVQRAILSALEVSSLGAMMIGNLPAFALGAILGWRGAALGVVLDVFTLGAGATPNQRVVGTLIVGGAALMGALFHRLVEELDRAYARLHALALNDALTGLRNRRALEEDFAGARAGAARRGVPLTLVAWDLDDLKRVNDSRGHAAGDAYLRAFSRALAGAARVDDRLYRTGGDEFVSLHAGLGDATALVDRARDAFPAVSAGWASVEGRDLDAVWRDADALLYRSKLERRGLASIVQIPA